MCLSNFSLSSKITPKFLTQGFTDEDNSPKFIFGVLTESEGPNTIISVLLSLKLRKFKDSQAFTSAKQVMSDSKPLELFFKGKYI
jgi:hypothetical protein